MNYGCCKRRLLITSTLLLGLLLAPLPAAASGGITVVENKAESSFAQQITFTLRAASESEISSVYLFFRAIGDEQARSEAIDFEPGQEITVSYVHDLRRFPLPPFTRVTFWWWIEDQAGNELTTEPRQIEYTDNRFDWEQLGAAGVTVHWPQGRGDPAFGQAALDIATTSLTEINAELHAPLPPDVSIYVYDAQYNLDAAMLLTGHDWVVGQAHPDLGVILVAVPDDEGYVSRMKRYIPHEITHLLVYQAVTPAGYKYVPEWLDEGLATANEKLPTPEFDLALTEAREAGQLLPLEYLCVPFPPDQHTAILAYAQSGSVVRFIRARYGAAGIRALLAAYAGGASCASGVQDALGVSLGGLETAWRASLEPQAPWQATFDRVGVWVGLWLLSLLAAVPMIGGLRRR